MLTPQTEMPELAKALGIQKLFLKREDMHPLGSHKGRSIPVMIDTYAARGEKRFSISSSGNAALAAAKHIQEKNRNGDGLSLEIFIGENIPEEKKAALGVFADTQIKIFEKERPLQALLERVRLGARGLRQSTDDTALVGYESLAEELATIPDLSAIFIATSSGTTAQALGEFFLQKKNSPEIHIVQTSSCHPMAAIFDLDGHVKETSIANAIADKVAHRRGKIMEIITKTKGSGWIVSNDEIKSAQEKLKTVGISVSENGALAYVGVVRALGHARKFSGSVVCIIGGR